MVGMNKYLDSKKLDFWIGIVDVVMEFCVLLAYLRKLYDVFVTRNYIHISKSELDGDNAREHR